MTFKDFETIIAKVKAFERPKRVVVAAAYEDHIFESVFGAQKQGIVYPVLVGEKEKNREMLRKYGYISEDYEIVDAPEGICPSQKAVDVINAGDGDFLMKGLMETRDFLKPVIDKKNNLNIGGVMSHFTLADMPSYHKLIALSDAAVVINPTLEEKKAIINNAVRTLKSIGYDRPKVAILCAVEVCNPKMQDTVDAVKLVEMWEKGEIPDCDLAGPLSYDLVMSAESARTKCFDCPWCGDFDLIIVPQMNTGNILIKTWHYSAGANMAGIIVGAKVPIVLTSRSTDTVGKYLSLVTAAACC
ncbi:MAG TPA: phosphate butyryltransferase [Clostridiales bacterium]|nr:phosphate butyryltransferase [Clostridiales bacterium]